MAERDRDPENRARTAEENVGGGSPPGLQGGPDISGARRRGDRGLSAEDEEGRRSPMSAKSNLNRHLYLRNGVWWTRIDRSGLSERNSTGCPKSEVVAARLIRNKRLAEVAERREGVERPGRVLQLGELLAAYLADESGFYDRE